MKKLLSVIPIAGAVVCVFIAMRLTSFVGGFELIDSWTSEYRLLGMLAFAVVGGVAVVFFFPGSILMTASGAAFGLTFGFITAQLGATLGAALAFLVARYMARGYVSRWVATKPKFAAIDHAIGQEGWRIVLLTRCSPIFPYIFQNYAYGLTRVSFGHYALGSFFGLLPVTAVFVYMGALGRTGAEAAASGASALQIGLWVLGFVATVAVGVYVTRFSSRALQQAGL